MHRSSWIDSLVERLLVALVSGVAAILTLALYPAALLISFFWGTHRCWARLGAYLDDKLSDLQTEYNVPLWLLIALLAILAAVVVANHA